MSKKLLSKLLDLIDDDDKNDRKRSRSRSPYKKSSRSSPNRSSKRSPNSSSKSSSHSSRTDNRGRSNSPVQYRQSNRNYLTVAQNDALRRHSIFTNRNFNKISELESKISQNAHDISFLKRQIQPLPTHDSAETMVIPASPNGKKVSIDINAEILETMQKTQELVKSISQRLDSVEEKVKCNK